MLSTRALAGGYICPNVDRGDPTNDNEDDLVPAIENDDHLDNAKTKNLTAHAQKVQIN